MDAHFQTMSARWFSWEHRAETLSWERRPSNFVRTCPVGLRDHDNSLRGMRQGLEPGQISAT